MINPPLPTHRFRLAVGCLYTLKSLGLVLDASGLIRLILPPFLVSISEFPDLMVHIGAVTETTENYSCPKCRHFSPHISYFGRRQTLKEEKLHYWATA